MLKERLTEEFNNIKYSLRGTNLKLLRLVFVVSILLSIPVTVYLAQRGFFRTSLAGVTATFSLSPSSFLLPGDKTVSLLLDTGTSKAGFAQAEIKFDQSKAKIVNFTPGSQLTRSLLRTDFTSANQNGTFRLAFGLEPSSYSQAPSGIFEVGRFTFSSNTASSNIKSVISQDTANSQVVTLTTEEATLSPASAQAIINPQVGCTSISIVDVIVTGTYYDRIRMRIKNNATQTVYLTGSKVSWSSSQTGLTLDWFSWNGSQYYAGDSSVSPTTYDPTGVLTLNPGATGIWLGRFKGQPSTGLKGKFTPDLTVDLTCKYSRSVSR